MSDDILGRRLYARVMEKTEKVTSAPEDAGAQAGVVRNAKIGFFAGVVERGSVEMLGLHGDQFAGLPPIGTVFAVELRLAKTE